MDAGRDAAMADRSIATFRCADAKPPPCGRGIAAERNTCEALVAAHFGPSTRAGMASERRSIESWRGPEGGILEGDVWRTHDDKF